MPAIPSALVRLIERQPGSIHRTHEGPVIEELQALGVPLDSEFGVFFLNYAITCYRGHASDVELVDIDDGAIRFGTEFVHEVWELPQHLICLTSCQGEGCYLYDRNSGAVLDFSLADREMFLTGSVALKWDGFFQFLTWYLAE